MNIYHNLFPPLMIFGSLVISDFCLSSLLASRHDALDVLFTLSYLMLDLFSACTGAWFHEYHIYRRIGEHGPGCRACTAKKVPEDRERTNRRWLRAMSCRPSSM